ncbi:ATP-binding protein [Streptosporangium sp. NPDC002524]|uniref:ATP-binding protein n=1 Tax=Streptosporangium sp. NPDC002524 TaxID=3154537 RepID=UPI003321A662
MGYDLNPELIDAMIRLRPGGMIWRRTFPGRPDQASPARRFVRLLLDDSPYRDDAELIAAELISNALRHTASGQPHGTFVVEVTRKPDMIRITVYDCGWGGTPTFKRRPNTTDESGRGLATVAAVASRFGYRGTQAVGHAVWGQLSTASRPVSPDGHADVRERSPARSGS